MTGGVASAQWSPDGEVLVLVSGQGQLLLMNKVVIRKLVTQPCRKGQPECC